MTIKFPIHENIKLLSDNYIIKKITSVLARNKNKISIETILIKKNRIYFSLYLLTDYIEKQHIKIDI